jgi:uncharacterized protein YgiM (DUF1202 family)
VNKYRRWLRFAVIVALALFFLSAPNVLAMGPTTSAPLYSVTGTGVVNTGALNVRSGPGVGFNVVATLLNGQSVTLIGRNAHSSWVQIRTSTGLQGWVNARFLLSNIAIPSLPVTDAGTPTAVVTTGVLNVRSGPGVSFGVVTVAYQGHIVNLLGRNAAASWVKVQLPTSTQGWVNASLVQSSVAISSLAVVDGSTPAPPLTGTAVVATGALNVRSGPGVSYSVVTVISYGQTVTLIGRNSNATWAQIRLANGTVGWVNASLLQLSVALSSLPVTETSAAPTPTAVVNTWALNVRYGPGVGFAVLTSVSQGQQVTLLGRNSAGSWVQVRLANGFVGWVNAAFLQTNVVISTLPITG